ncbi:PaaI family thioesterase [Streptomyces piniterrae]|uniref:Medium/long-chain acyl-CoA thioesterase YigI n=1 Tax=Streptomyces piniterrae TaxID=2571125 RepID=A0A4U0NWL5_9ACTN|nr:PaaI family thioesterase [Streptomyces piniterrae]TJZ54614.1 PaaI family thioesterase [Streptomyces piniterrae]
MTAREQGRGQGEGRRSAALDLAAAQKALEGQPFSGLVGARITEFGDGGATLEIDVRDELLQQYGFVHGGVLAYAADNTITFAAATALGSAIITGGFSIQYLRPARGRTLRARAEVVQAGRRQAVCRCDLTMIDTDGTETVCAVAQGTAMPLNSPPNEAS